MVGSALNGGRAKARGAGTTNLSYFSFSLDNVGLCLVWGQSQGPRGQSQKSELIPLLPDAAVVALVRSGAKVQEAKSANLS